MADRDELRERAMTALREIPIGWNVDEDGKLWPPHEGHAHHRYDGGCAVCRCGDRPEALAAVVDAVLAALRLEQVGWVLPGKPLTSIRGVGDGFVEGRGFVAVYTLDGLVVRSEASETNRTTGVLGDGQ